MSRFDVQTFEGPGRATVQIAGEVDMACADLLAQALGAALSTRRLVVADCSQITFLDSSGLRVLLETRDLAETSHARFRLASVSEAVQRTLELSGTAALFDVDDEGQQHPAAGTAGKPAPNWDRSQPHN